MLNFQLVSDQKPGARHNEDLFGFKGDTFWLLDGATSTDGPPMARDAHWLVHELDTALNALATRELPVDVMAASACTHVADRWPSLSTRRPVAAMAVWRIRDGQLEAAITGNVSLLVPQGLKVVELTDDRIHAAHLGSEKALLDALARGLSFESEEFQTLRREMKEREAAALDIHANGWLATPAHRVPSDFRQFALPVAGPASMMAATDGFMELRRCLQSRDATDFMETACGLFGGLPAAIRELRAFELLSDSGQRFPRTKRHDDATVVLLQLS